MIISRRRVKATRKRWFCEGCQRCFEAGSPCVAIFGAAERGDPPYTIRLCEPCNARPPEDDS